jgi:Uncharacterized conserved protein
MTFSIDTLPKEDVPDFASFGIRAFTTTREAGTFSLSGADPAGEVMARWTGLQEALSPYALRTVIGRQVHGTTVLTHRGGWEGLLRTGLADGHLAAERGIALAVSIADCVPIFMAHQSGIVAILHSGWRGTVGKMIDAGLRAYARLGIAPDEIKVHSALRSADDATRSTRMSGLSSRVSHRTGRAMLTYDRLLRSTLPRQASPIFR